MTRNRMDRLPKTDEKKPLIEDFKTRNAKKFRGLLAPFKALEALEKGLTGDIETDIRRDVELFSECAISPIAKNLIGVFLNTRAAGRHRRIKGLEPAKLLRAAMLGGGVMGSGIVHLLLKNGFETILWDIDDQAIEKALANLRKTFAYPIKQKKMTEKALEELLRDHLVTTTSLDDLKEADLVIEAVLEDMQVKQEIWKKLEGICRPEHDLRDEHFGPAHHRNGLGPEGPGPDDRPALLQPGGTDAAAGDHLRAGDLGPDPGHRRILRPKHQKIHAGGQ